MYPTRKRSRSFGSYTRSTNRSYSSSRPRAAIYRAKRTMTPYSRTTARTYRPTYPRRTMTPTRRAYPWTTRRPSYRRTWGKNTTSSARKAPRFNLSATRAGSVRTALTRKSLRVLSDLISPCWRFYNDVTSHVLVPQQYQLPHFMFHGTMVQWRQLLTYDPSLTTAPFSTAMTGQLNLRQPVEEYTERAIYMNTNTVSPLILTAYYVKPRRVFTLSEISGGANVGTTNLANASWYKTTNANIVGSYDSTDYTKSSGLQWLLQDTLSFQAPASGKGPSGAIPDIGEAGFNMFNHQWFTRNFKVLKTRKLILRPGQRAEFSIKRRKMQMSLERLGVHRADYNNPFATHGSWALHPVYTRFWLIMFMGQVVPFGEVTQSDLNPGIKFPSDFPINNMYPQGHKTTGSTQKGFASAPGGVGIYHTSYFCIRPVIPSTNSIAYRLNDTPSLSNSTPYEIGHIPRAGARIVDYIGEESKPAFFS